MIHFVHGLIAAVALSGCAGGTYRGPMIRVSIGYNGFEAAVTLWEPRDLKAEADAKKLKAAADNLEALTKPPPAGKNPLPTIAP